MNKEQPAALSGFRCPGCDCELDPYEVQASWIRGLKKPVCLGCLIKILVDVRDIWLPQLRALEVEIGKLAELVPWEKLEARLLLSELKVLGPKSA